MAILNYDQIYGLAQNAGFSGQSADTITAIALAESQGNTNAIAYNDGGTGYNSYGLTQILGIHPGASNALDPQQALNQAYTISNGGTNFSPWSTYQSGAYQQYLGSGTGNVGANFTPPSSTPDYLTTSVTPGSQSSYPIADGSYGDPNISISQAYPDASGVPSLQNPLGGTDAQNLQNYGYFGLQPTSDAVTEPTGATNTSILNQSADQLLAGGQGDVSGTGNAANYNYFGLPMDAGNSLITGATSLASGASAGSWWNWAVGVTLDFVERFGLIILGVVLIAGAAWALSREAKE